MRYFLAGFLVLAFFAAFAGCGERAANGTSGTAPPADAAAEAGKAKAREEIVAKREADRLAALWSYNEVPVGKKRQLSASIYSTNDVDTDGKGPKSVRLVFRDHPEWGRSSYLVLQGGDFNCYGRCNVNVKVEDEAAKPMAGRRPPTDEAIAMFINDSKALWRLTTGGKRLAIEFPVKAGGTRTATFDVAGLDRSQLPGW